MVQGKSDIKIVTYLTSSTTKYSDLVILELAVCEIMNIIQAVYKYAVNNKTMYSSTQINH